MANDMMVKDLDEVVVRFSGDWETTSAPFPTIRQTSAPRKVH